MIRLEFPTEPYWIDLPLGVRVQVRPITGLIVRPAQHSATRRQGELLETMNGQEEPPAAREALYEQLLAEELVAEELARFGVVAWEGVLDANDRPLLCRPTTVAEPFAKVWQLGRPFRDGYLVEIEARSTEGNGSLERRRAPDRAGGRRSAAASDLLGVSRETALEWVREVEESVFSLLLMNYVLYQSDRKKI